MTGYYGPAPIDLSAVKEKKNTSEKQKPRWEEGLYKYCRYSRHIAASCPRKLMAAAGQVEIIPFKENTEKGKKSETESRKVKSSAIRIAIVLETNLFINQC